MSYSQTISISPEFFKKERDNYSDIAFSFWRELFQNSVDAGAKNIKVNLNDNKVKFIDDGCGMPRDILSEVYFSLGSTSKTDGSTVGGFGKARIITCFSNHSYEIISCDYIAEGRGASYDVVDSGELVDGCQVSIDVDTEDVYGHIDLRDGLKKFLAYSQLKCDLTSNKFWVNEYNDWLQKRGKVKELSFGTIYANKNGRFNNKMIVRVNGVAMFDSYVGADYQVVLEINPDISREVLLSNRDSLRGKYQTEIDNFIQQLDVNSNVLKTEKTKVSLLGGGCFTEEFDPDFGVEDVEEESQNGGEGKRVSSGQAAFVDSSRGGMASSEARNILEQKPIDIDPYSSDYIGDEDIESMMLLCDSDSDALKKSFYRYNPAHWKNGQGRDIISLLKIWIISCRITLEELQKLGDHKSTIHWRPGFVFSDEARALRFSTGTGISNLLINPVDKDGKKDYSINSKADRARIVSKAIHEICHLVESNHNEAFASWQTTLTGLVFGRMGEINKEIKRQINSEKMVLA